MRLSGLRRVLGMERGKLRIFSSRGQQYRKILVGILPEGKELLVLRSTALYVAGACFGSG
jgi:hypothetical protein